MFSVGRVVGARARWYTPEVVDLGELVRAAIQQDDDVQERCTGSGVLDSAGETGEREW